MMRNTVSKLAKSLGLIATAICIATAAFATDDMMVQIKYGDGDALSGLLIAKDETSIRVATEFLGIVTVPVAGSSCIGAGCPDSMRAAPVVEDVKVASDDLGINAIENSDKLALKRQSPRPDLEDLQQRSKLVSCQGAGCFKTLFPSNIAQPVMLKKGSITIEGVLTGFEPDAYILKTAQMGEVRVASTFECIGESCPTH